MHLTGRAVLLLLIVAPILAAATWLPVMQWLALAYFLLCLLLFAYDWRQAGTIERFDLLRHHDSKLSLGADNVIELALTNRRRQPPQTVLFTIRDEPPEVFAIGRRILEGSVGPAETWQGRYTVRPLRRGDYQFGNVNLRWQGPWGMVVRQGVVEATAAVKVYPNLLDVRRYDFLLRNNRLQELGLRHARLPGRGTEFERLREYRPDDEYRRINWKATARRHRPITVEYQTEKSQSIMAVLETGRMMQSPVANMAKLDYAINAVLLLGYVAAGIGDKVGMMSFADKVTQFLPPRQGRGQFNRMLERLYAVEAQPVEPAYGRALRYLAHQQRKRALLILFTDLTGGSGLRDLVAHAALLARRNLFLVVTISDPDVHQYAAARPQDSDDVYQRAAADRLLAERQLTLESLQKQAVQTLDVPANQLSISVIDRYLELKRNLRL